MLNFNYKQLTIICILISCLFVANTSKAQDYNDTLKIKAGYILKLNDTLINIKNDTVILIKSGTKYRIRKSNELKTEKLNDKLKEKSTKNWFYRELYNNLIVPEKDTTKKKTNKFEKSDKAFIPFEGKIIGEIILKRLDVFGGSVRDTSLHTQSKFLKAIENTHVNTRNYVIRKNLFFKAGQKINAIVFADTERLLRSLSYLTDAKIIIKVRKENSKIADVYILTKDNYSIAIDGAFSNFQDWNIKLKENNFLGLGYEFANTLFYNSLYTQIYGYNGYFIIDNIASSFISGEFNYLNTARRVHSILDFKRDFISVKTKYGGGLKLGQINTNWNYYYQDSSYSVPYIKNFADFWVGRALKFKNKKSSIVISSRYYIQNYTKRNSIIASDTNQYLHNRQIALAGITYRNREFYKTSMLLDYDVVEDVPVGLLLQLVGGYEYGEYTNRHYYTFRYGKAMVLPENKYFAVSASIGSYFRNYKAEETLAKINLRYFTNLLTYGNYKFRNIVEVSYTEGFNSLYYESFNFRDEIFGINRSSPRGIQKASLSFETVSFLPIRFYRFKFTAFNFIDLGFINSNVNLYNKENFYTGIGFGLRISNKNLVFDAFNLSFTFYPKVDNNTANYLLNFEAEKSKLFNEIDICKPGMINF